jgi:hypothetical protein
MREFGEEREEWEMKMVEERGERRGMNDGNGVMR